MSLAVMNSCTNPCFFLTSFGFGLCESVKCLGEGLSRGLMGNEIRVLHTPMQSQGETSDLTSYVPPNINSICGRSF